MNTILVIILIAIVLFLIVEFIKYTKDRIKSKVYKKQCNEEEPNENN